MRNSEVKKSTSSEDTAKERPSFKNTILESSPEFNSSSFEQSVSDALSEELTWLATSSLKEQKPEYSAATPFPKWMIALYFITPVLFAAFVGIGPNWAMLMASILLFPLFLGSFVIRFCLLWLGKPREEPAVLEINPHELPRLSVLVPVYDEPKTMPVLIEALRNLAYPHEKLDALILLESGDDRTKEALNALDLPSFLTVLTIPKSLPQTKPKAMNYALPFVRGQYVCIFDAEDIPNPDQPLIAIQTLLTAEEDIACVQSALNHFNRGDNFLTLGASMEYAMWFDRILERLGRLGLPVPLGGTSLYVDAQILRDVGGWDPANVTEDADLGIRLARHGYRTKVIQTTTLEEATGNSISWVRQRSRWIKGFMQSWAVHMRRPDLLIADLGWRRAAAMNVILLEGFLAYFAQPFFLLAGGIFLFRGTDFSSLSNTPFHLLCVFLLIAAQLMMLILAAQAVLERFGWRQALLAPLLWLYWQLGGLAAYLAAYELAFKPQYWAKTDHGNSPEFNMIAKQVLRQPKPDNTCRIIDYTAHSRYDRSKITPKNRYGQPRLSEGSR